jgi:hypothetical protein
MSAKKTPQNKGIDPLKTVRVNISMTHGTTEVLKKTADHRHVSVSALVTCLIRTEAERVGLLPSRVQNVVPPITVVEPPQKKKSGTK